MAPNDSTEELEIKLVLEAIHEQYGYDFRDYASDSIQRRVHAVLAKSGAAHFGELQHRLLTEPTFFASLLGGLTVQLSEMFRDPKFYRAFREKVIPVLRTYPQLKIWHAGCASGEEVYTTAIILTEANLYERTQIYATDVSAAVLEQAREGVYPAEHAAKFAESYRESGGKSELSDYYSSAYGRIAVRESLRKNVVFFQHDLVSDYALGEMHVIFCRNVLIYFGATLRERVIDMFARGLYRGGFLCLGASECLPKTRAGLFEEYFAEERIFRRRGEP